MLFHMLPVCQMLHMLYRTLPVCQMLHMQYHMPQGCLLHRMLPLSAARLSRSIQKCLIMPFRFPPKLCFLWLSPVALLS